MKLDRHTFSFSPALATALALGLFAIPDAWSQAGPPALDQQRFTQGQQFYEAGKYAEAIKAFESIQKDFPTSAFIPVANLQAGLCYYFTGEFDQGVLALRKNLAGKNVSPEVLESSQGLLPQLLGSKAQRLPAGDPGRKPTFDTAIKEFDTFIQKYPQSPEVEQANLGKAQSYYALEKYEESAQALRVNMQKFPASESALDTQYMLARVLGTQGDATMKAQTTPGESKAAAVSFEEAEKLLTDIINKRSDLALMNDSQFQLGEIFTARSANTERGEKQDAILYKALDAFRTTYPKEAVIEGQKMRIKFFQDKKREVGTKGDMANFKRLENLILREQGKLADLDQRADQTLAAKIKSGQIYLTLHKDKDRERMDEARVLFRFVEQFTEDAEQKKQILYYLTVTYAVQHLVERAEEHYKKWTAAFKNDPMGENLPLLMGGMYLDSDPKKNNPQKAIEYFNKQETDFPTSKYTGDAAMQAALAMIQLKQYDEGVKRLKAFLEKRPPAEQAAGAEFGLAIVYKDTGKVDEAIETFRAVRNKYPSTDQAEQAGYWVGQMLYGKGDPKGAATELKEYLTKFPKSDLVPVALLTLAQAQRDAGQREPAMATFKELAEKHPKSEAAPYSYFQQAALLHSENKYDELRAVMKDFISKYPESDRVFAAYDYVALVSLQEKKPEEAIASYEEFATKFSASPNAPNAILKISDQWKKNAEALGPVISIPMAKRDEWRKQYDNCVAAAERILEKYPESPEVALALQNLLKAQKQFVLAKLKADANVENYFNELGKKYADKPALVSKIKFTLAGYFAKSDKPKSLKMMADAYDPKLVYAPADLDVYAKTLIDEKKYDDVQKIADKIAAEFPLPPNSDPATLARSITEPAAMALFYKGKVLQLTGKTAEAAGVYEQLKKQYPWSPKLAEADLGIAKDLFQQKRYDEATELLKPVASQPKGSPEVRATAMMLLGQISEAEGDFESAINNYVKIGTFFEGLPEFAAEGLWRGAQLQEKKASGEIKQLPKAPEKEEPKKTDAKPDEKAKVKKAG